MSRYQKYLILAVIVFGAGSAGLISHTRTQAQPAQRPLCDSGNLVQDANCALNSTVHPLEWAIHCSTPSERRACELRHRDALYKLAFLVERMAKEMARMNQEIERSLRADALGSVEVGITTTNFQSVCAGRPLSTGPGTPQSSGAVAYGEYCDGLGPDRFRFRLRRP